MDASRVLLFRWDEQQQSWTLQMKNSAYNIDIIILKVLEDFKKKDMYVVWKESSLFNCNREMHLLSFLESLRINITSVS